MHALKGLIVGACAYAALVGGASAQILDQKAISLGEAKKPPLRAPGPPLPVKLPVKVFEPATPCVVPE